MTYLIGKVLGKLSKRSNYRYFSPKLSWNLRLIGEGAYPKAALFKGDEHLNPPLGQYARL